MQGAGAVYAEEKVMRDLNDIRSKYGSFLQYYEDMGLVKRQTVNKAIQIKNIKISFLSVPGNKCVSVFVFESAGKKLIYAPCDCKPFPNDELLLGADVLIIGNTFIGNVLKDNKVINSRHPLRKELYSFEEAMEIKERLGIGRMVITHLEEDWGKTYDDYVSLEKKYDNVQFAFDGMEIAL